MRRRSAGHPDQVVEADRARPEQRDDARALAWRRDRSRAARRDPRARAASIGRSMIGATALMTSAASVTSVAPCLIRSLVPAARGSSGEPGTANTSRPCSLAIRAVISEPERCAASTTTTPSAAPEISRLRRGKSRARGSWPSGISEIAAPWFEHGGQQILMLGRIDPVVAAGQHRDRAAREAGAMRRLIDAARQPGDDDKAGFAKIARQLACKFQPGAGSVAGADDRDHRPHQRCRARRERRATAAHHPGSRAAADSRPRPERAG